MTQALYAHMNNKKKKETNKQRNLENSDHQLTQFHNK
jgi:hypothetical protein